MKFSAKLIAISFLFLLSACGNTSDLNQSVLNEIPAQNVQPGNESDNTVITESTHTIRSLVIDILYKYDHNKNGQIDYRDSNTFFKNIIHRNENYRYTTSFSTIADKSTLTTTIYSMDKLFFASDTNHDGITTPEEITNFIKTTYDKNNDDELQSRGWKIWKSPDEYQIYNKEVGEAVKSVSSVNTGNTQNNNNNTTPVTSPVPATPVNHPAPPVTQPAPTIVVNTQ
jgi:hypothetical protein